MCLRIPIRRSLFHGNLEQLGSNASAGHNVKFSGGTWHRIKIRERGPSRGIIQKCEFHEHSPCARRFEEKSHEETSKQESWFRKAAWDLAKNIYKLRNKDEATFYSPVEIQALVLVSKSPEERVFFGHSGLYMHMLGNRDLSSDEMDTLRRSTSPITVVPANGEVQTKRGSTSICSRSWPVRDCNYSDETPAVLSLGKLCKEYGYSYEWVQRSRITVGPK